MLAIITFSALSLLATAVSAANHTIIVGGKAGLVFTPETLDPAVGDFVSFVFESKNHTVTQSAFATPCTLLENATINAVGFSSGFVPVTEDATELPVWTVEITAATPIWFYCAQGKHCSSGMVGSFNAAKTGDKTHEAFKALALKAQAPGAAGATPSAVTAASATGVAATSAGSDNVAASALSGVSTTRASSDTSTANIPRTAATASLLVAVSSFALLLA